MTSRAEQPTDARPDTQSTSNATAPAQSDQATTGKKRRNHRAGKKKKTRRQSFAVPGAEGDNTAAMRPSQDPREQSRSTGSRPPFYRLGQSGGRNLSETSLDSEMLLDHRLLLILALRIGYRLMSQYQRAEITLPYVLGEKAEFFQALSARDQAR